MIIFTLLSVVSIAGQEPFEDNKIFNKSDDMTGVRLEVYIPNPTHCDLLLFWLVINIHFNV